MSGSKTSDGQGGFAEGFALKPAASELRVFFIAAASTLPADDAASAGYRKAVLDLGRAFGDFADRASAHDVDGDAFKGNLRITNAVEDISLLTQKLSTQYGDRFAPLHAQAEAIIDGHRPKR